MFVNTLGSHLKSVLSTTVQIKFWHRRFLQFFVNPFLSVLKIPISKFRFFVINDSRGFWTIFLFAKFVEILKTGSLEIGKFLHSEQSVSIYRATAHAWHLTRFSGATVLGSPSALSLVLRRILPVTNKSWELPAGFFASLPVLHIFVIRLKPSVHCVQL